MPIWDFQNWIRTWGSNRDFFMRSKEHSLICLKLQSILSNEIDMYNRRRAEWYSSDEALDTRRFGHTLFPYILENCRVSERLFPDQARNDLIFYQSIGGIWMKNLLLLMGIGSIETLSESLESPTIRAWVQMLKEKREGGKKIFCRMNGIQLPDLTKLMGICSVVK